LSTVLDGSNLKETMQIEYENKIEQRAALQRLIGIEDRVYLQVEGSSSAIASSLFMPRARKRRKDLSGTLFALRTGVALDRAPSGRRTVVRGLRPSELPGPIAVPSVLASLLKVLQ
jgi:hypothetical protein